MRRPFHLRTRAPGLRLARARLGAAAIVLATGVLFAPGAANAIAGSRVQGLAPVASVPRLPEGVRRTGPLAGGASVHLTLALQPSDAAGLSAIANAVSTPGSPSYRHFLSPGEVERRFGPDPTASASVRSWLRSQGLVVGQAIGDGLVLPVSGSADAVSTAFHTALSSYALAGGGTAYANTTTPQVPSEIAAAVQGVVGLSSFSTLHTNHEIQPAPKGDLPAGAGEAPPRRAAGPTTAGVGTFTGSSPTPCSDFTSVVSSSNGGAATTTELGGYFDVGPLYADSLTGAGITVGLLELHERFSATDVAAFNNCYGTNVSVTAVPVSGGCTFSAGCDSPGDETTMDIQTVMGFAPGAAIKVFEAPGLTDASLLADEAAAVSANTQVVSASLGECEPDETIGDPSFATSEQMQFAAMAAQGQSMFVSSGDSGSEGCIQDTGSSTAYREQLAVSDPASQANVVAVGGTTIPNLTDPSTEQAWNAGPFTGPNHGNTVDSGGISSIWTMPSFQVGFDVNGDSSGTPCGATGGSLCREVPDVAATADPLHSGYLFVENCSSGTVSSCSIMRGGGTSISAPMWAAFTALGDQGSSGASNRLGFLDPALYAADTAFPSVFNDVSIGHDNYLSSVNNICHNAGIPNQPCYPATTGYDMATGLGTPFVGPLFNSFALDSLAVTTSGLPQATTGVGYSQSLTRSGGSTTITWSLLSGSLPAGLVLNASTGAISGTPTGAGTSLFTVRATDGRGVHADASLSITVNAAPQVTTASLPGATIGSSYSAALSASGGTLPLSWSLATGGLPSGLSLSPAGLISGTPTGSGVSSFTVVVVDANHSAGAGQLSLGTSAVSTSPSSVSTATTASLSSPSSSKATSSGRASAAASRIVADSASVTANGSKDRVTVTLRTAGGKAVSGRAVSLQAAGGHSRVVALRATTNRNGAATFEVSDRTVERVTYRATDTKDRISLKARLSVAFTAPPSPGRSSIAAGPATVRSCPRAGGHVTVVVTLRSATGAVLPGRRMSLGLSGFRGKSSPSSAMTNAAGAATFTLTDATPQSVRITAHDVTDRLSLPRSAAVRFAASRC